MNTEGTDLRSKKIGVMMGGFGNERNISLESGEYIYQTLVENGYNAFRVDPADNFLETLAGQQFDVMFNILHGPIGEDGIIQAVLEFLKVPYTSEGVLPSGLAFDKLRTKEVLIAYGLPTPDYFPFYDLDPRSVSVEQIISDLNRADFNFPFFFKKAASGSSREVWQIKSKEEFKQVISESTFLQSPAEFFVEQGVSGQEISVGVWKNQGEIQVLPIAACRTDMAFFTYDAKYKDGMSETEIPAPIPKECEDIVRAIVKKMYHVLTLRGAVRIDIMLDENFSPYVLEINNQPGQTSHSLIPEMFQKAGVPMIDFITGQLSDALRRMQNEG